MTLTLQFVIENADSLFTHYRWGQTATCPYCGSQHVYKGTTRYKCAHCGHRFTAKTATLFHSSNLSIKTIMTGIYLMLTNRGISSYILSTQLGISQPSAWSLQTRLRYALLQFDLQGEYIMADEAYIGGKVSNMHRMKKYALCEEYGLPTPDGHIHSRALANAHQKHVMGMTDENRKVYLQYAPEGMGHGRALDIVLQHAPSSIHLTTDESSLYQLVPDEQHAVVNHSQYIYKTPDGYSTNPCENMFGWFKGQADHNHRHQSRKYITGYLNEFAFRRNHRNIDERMEEAFRLFIVTRITLKELTK